MAAHPARTGATDLHTVSRRRRCSRRYRSDRAPPGTESTRRNQRQYPAEPVPFAPETQLIPRRAAAGSARRPIAPYAISVPDIAGLLYQLPAMR
eukprot:1655148-Rhodomonas_salina.1